VRKPILLFTCLSVLLGSCSNTVEYFQLSDEDKKTHSSAICKANKHLQKNGYFQKKTMADKDDLTLEMWDNINYEKDGVFDWQQLLNDRAGLFENTLHGIKSEQEEYLIFYKLSNSYRCLSIDKIENPPFLHEANCFPDNSMILVLESDINCDEKGSE